MARSANAGRISINLSAGTAQFVVDMEKANAKIRELGDAHKHTVSDVQATSAALRTLEGGVTNNLRAAENFIAKTLNLGGVLKTAFPVVGAIALGGVIFELVQKVGDAIEAFKKLQEAPARIAQAFEQMAEPIRVTNLELQIANDRLENDIRKLEGRPQNNLALALHEAELSAEKLAESLGHVLEQEQKVLEAESISSLKGFFTKTAPTEDLEKQLKSFRERITNISLEANTRLEKEPDETKRAAIYAEASRQRVAAIREETTFLRQQLEIAEALQKTRDRARANPQFEVGSQFGPTLRRGEIDRFTQDPRIATIRGELEPLQAILAGIPLQNRNDALKKQKDALTEAADNAKLDAPAKNKIDELQAQLRGLRTEVAAAQAEAKVPDSNDLLPAALAKGAAEADKALTVLRIRLEPLKQKVSLSQVIDITTLTRSIAIAEAQKKAADEFNRKQQEIIRGSEEVADKIAAEETKRQDLISRLREQTSAATALSAAESKGAEAVFQAQEKIKLAKVEDPDVRAQTQALDEAEHAAAIQKTVVQLDRETEATKRLAAAVVGGEDARRQAELENIKASGAEPTVIEAQLRARKAQFELQDAAQLKGLSAADGVKAYFQQIVDSAQSAAANVKQVMTSAFEGINDNLARAISGQKTSFADLFKGISADIAKLAIQQGEVALVKGVGGGLLGKKDSQPFDERIPGVSGGGGITGTLGKIFGFGGTTGRDGNSAATAIYVTMGDVSSASKVPGLQDLFGSGESSGGDDSSGGDSGGGGFLGNLFQAFGGFLGNLFQAFGGFRAAGGDVDPGSAYIVGENGPELFRPGSAGAIVPNHQLGGNNIYYSIDARGTDPVQSELRLRSAIVAAHQSAVSTSLEANREQVRRAPQR